MGLSYPTINAEQVVFRDLYTNSTFVTDNGGSAVGAPSFNNGAVLNGTTQYVTYNGLPIWGKSKISFEFTFSPTFATDEDANRYICDSTAGSQYIIAKLNNASSNVLRINLGDTNIVDVVEATYSPFWVVNGYNHLVVASDGTNTDVYLNNNLIVDADATAWTPASPTTLYVGADNADANFFAGTILSCNIYSVKLTLVEVNNRYTNSVFSIIKPENAELWIPFRTWSYDGSSVARTTNLGNLSGQTGIRLGNGSTATTFPTQIFPHGMSFDGGDYLYATTALAISNTTSYTFFGSSKNTYTAAPTYLLDARASTQGIGAYLETNGTLIAVTDAGGVGNKVTSNDIFSNGALKTWTIVFEANGVFTTCYIYINGELDNWGYLNNFTNQTVNVVIGARFNIASAYRGSQYDIGGFIPFTLTPTQVRWLSDYMLSNLNI